LNGWNNIGREDSMLSVTGADMGLPVEFVAYVRQSNNSPF
jgi:hypothetical protein